MLKGSDPQYEFGLSPLDQTYVQDLKKLGSEQVLDPSKTLRLYWNLNS